MFSLAHGRRAKCSSVASNGRATREDSSTAWPARESLACKSPWTRRARRCSRGASTALAWPGCADSIRIRIQHLAANRLGPHVDGARVLRRGQQEAVKRGGSEAPSSTVRLQKRTKMPVRIKSFCLVWTVSPSNILKKASEACCTVLNHVSCHWAARASACRARAESCSLCSATARLAAPFQAWGLLPQTTRSTRRTRRAPCPPWPSAPRCRCLCVCKLVSTNPALQCSRSFGVGPRKHRHAHLGGHCFGPGRRPKGQLAHVARASRAERARSDWLSIPRAKRAIDTARRQRVVDGRSPAAPSSNSCVSGAHF